MIRWHFINFENEEQMNHWIEDNGDKYQWVEVFVYKGYQIKYRRAWWKQNR